MALNKITYDDKSNYQSSSLANMYKVSASDMNEVKTVVNGICDQVDNMSTYSTTETAIGTWTDGKILYRKNFLVTAQDTLHNISNIDYRRIVSAMVYDPNLYGDRDVSNDIIFQSNKFWLTNNALSLVSNGIKLIVEYTKTS